MINWQDYVRASYDIVIYAEPNVQPKLDETLESYLVHMLARNFLGHSFGEKPVAISFLESSSLPGYQKKQAMSSLGDECLYISGFGLKKNKWPSKTYYSNMGSMAYGYAAISLLPMDPLYSHLENNFTLLEKVIQQISKEL